MIMATFGSPVQGDAESLCWSRSKQAQRIFKLTTGSSIVNSMVVNNTNKAKRLSDNLEIVKNISIHQGLHIDIFNAPLNNCPLKIFSALLQES